MKIMPGILFLLSLIVLPACNSAAVKDAPADSNGSAGKAETPAPSSAPAVEPEPECE